MVIIDLQGVNLRGIPPASISTHREDVWAILKAQRDLGPDYDDHATSQILDRLSSAPLKAEVETHAKRHHPLSSVMPIWGISIPLLALAGGIDGQTGVLAVLGLDAIALLTLTRRR